MGFSFRGKVSSQPVADTQTSGSDAAVGEVIDPEVQLKKFKKLHKWDPFMDIDKLDAADEYVTTYLYQLIHICIPIYTIYIYVYIFCTDSLAEFYAVVISRKKQQSRHPFSRKTRHMPKSALR